MSFMIKNAKLVLENRICESGWLLSASAEKGGKIMALGSGLETPEYKEAVLLADEILDAEENYLAPGLIDLHLHGGNGYDFMDGTKEAIHEIAGYHSSHGITSMLATTLAGEQEETCQALRAFAEYAPEVKTCHLLGVHLEGPYFNRNQRGAQDSAYLVNPDRKQCEKLIETGCVRRISLAPELPGALEMGEWLAGKGILVSAGHTEADYDMIEAASKHGFDMLTHLYSGMLGVHRKGLFRYGGAVEAGLLLDNLWVEVIADGCHLPGCLLRLVHKCKGSRNMILITDAMRGAGLPEGAYTRLGSVEKGQEAVIEDGVAKLADRSSFAGSIASGDRLIRTMREQAGVPLYEAVAMMTANPARLLGMEKQKGSLKPGMDSDFILFDENITMKAVWTGGRNVFSC